MEKEATGGLPISCKHSQDVEQNLHAMQIQAAVKESVGQLPNLVAIQITEWRREKQKRVF